MKRALVYGADGFIGKKLVEKLAKQDIEVISVVPDFVDEKSKDELKKHSLHVFECNLNKVRQDLKQIVQEQIDVTYFLAWDGLTNDGLLDYGRQINNVTYMLDLMRVSGELGAEKFIGSGSITQQELFRDEGKYFLTDKHRFYRVAQQACEDMGNALANELGLLFIWPLLTNVYGVGENSPRLINSLIRSLLKNEDFPTSPGEQLYDFVYVDDVVNIYYELGKCKPFHEKAIIGSGQPMKLKEYLEIVHQLIGGEGAIRLGTFEYKGMYYTRNELDATPLLSRIQYSIKNDFQTGIKKTIDWMRNEE